MNDESKEKKSGVWSIVGMVALILVLWPLGLTGIWLNFAGTAVLAAVLGGILLRREHADLARPDAPVAAE